MLSPNHKFAIIVGAGAVENAWKPLIKCFNSINDNEMDEDSVNFLFTKHICALRLYSKSSKGASELREELITVKLLKEVICDSLKLAQQKGELKPRKEFEAILNKFVFTNPNNQFGFVTTNWDTVIDKEVKRLVKEKFPNLNPKVLHIHGSIDEHQHLYLPSETTMENYRSDEENDKLGYNHYITYLFLKEAKSIILYGLSLDPLDAELSLLLSGTFASSKNIKEVIIINPDCQKVRKRVKVLLYGKKGIDIKCFHPNNLELNI